MYHLINTHIQAILGAIPQNHVTDYDWLLPNLNQCAKPQYQARYKNFWRLNAARLDANYLAVYFQKLQAAQAHPPSIANLTQQLYTIPTHKNGRQSLQFSFTTKLLHMINPHLPIYDSLVAALYFFKEPNHNKALQPRIATYVAFHNFLATEYQRILTNKLLATSIQMFRQQFNPQQFTDEKTIDSLLWAYVGLLKKGGLINGTIIYY